MKTITLTQGFVAIVDDEDYERINAHKWHFSEGYAVSTLPGGKTIKMHREVMRAPDGDQVDHVLTGDTLNNQKINLRLATPAQNSMNRFPPKTNTSGYKGVYFNKSRGKWQAHIMIDQKKIYLGRFDDPVDAARAYDAAAREYFGEFARLNF